MKLAHILRNETPNCGVVEGDQIKYSNGDTFGVDEEIHLPVINPSHILALIWRI